MPWANSQTSTSMNQIRPTSPPYHFTDDTLCAIRACTSTLIGKSFKSIDYYKNIYTGQHLHSTCQAVKALPIDKRGSDRLSCINDFLIKWYKRTASYTRNDPYLYTSATFTVLSCDWYARSQQPELVSSHEIHRVVQGPATV